MAINYRAVHENKSWRKIGSHTSLFNAIKGPKGAISLLSDSTSYTNKLWNDHGAPLFVFVWSDEQSIGFGFRIYRRPGRMLAAIQFAKIKKSVLTNWDLSKGTDRKNFDKYFPTNLKNSNLDELNIPNPKKGKPAAVNGVETYLDIQKNIAVLEFLKNQGDPKEKDYYKQLIKKGTCFFPYILNGVISFAPSRFLGYKNNNPSVHEENVHKDGRVTTSIITKVVGHRPQPNPALESLYKEFCLSLGISPNESGNFGVPRKYWLTVDAFLDLDENFEFSTDRDVTLPSTVREALIKVRVGQGIFRSKLLKYWRNKCCITNCTLLPVLKASHIKPWIDSNNKERLDEYNGLLLSPNIDALFDRGLISFTNGGKIIYSDRADRTTLDFLIGPTPKLLKLESKHFPYLEFHRTQVFDKIGDYSLSQSDNALLQMVKSEVETSMKQKK